MTLKIIDATGNAQNLKTILDIQGNHIPVHTTANDFSKEFIISDEIIMNASGIYDLLVIAPTNTDPFSTIYFKITGTGTFTVQFFEAPVTTEIGTNKTFQHTNRYLENPANTIISTMPVITSPGNELSIFNTGAFILKNNESYLFRITAHTDNSRINYIIRNIEG